MPPGPEPAAEPASIATTLWERGETLHQTRLAEAMPAASPVANQLLSQSQGAGLTAAQGFGLLTQQAVSQAFLLATIDLFRLCGWLSVLLIPLIWLTRKAKAPGASEASETSKCSSRTALNPSRVFFSSSTIRMVCFMEIGTSWRNKPLIRNLYSLDTVDGSASNWGKASR